MQKLKLKLECFESLDSTNTYLKERAKKGAPEGTVVIANAQTGGRGRMGRSFCSPPALGIYMSLLLRPEAKSDCVQSLTAFTAVAVCRAIESLTGLDPEIKWINDIMLNGKKICGILAEAKFSKEAVPDYAVLGIGINLLAPQGGFPAEIRDIAGAVFPQGTDADAAFDRCAAALTDALLDEYAGIRERHYLAGYKARLCVIGKAITVCENGTERPAFALAADDDLRLLVRYEDDGSEQWRATGEIRIRLK